VGAALSANSGRDQNLAWTKQPHRRGGHIIMGIIWLFVRLKFILASINN